MENVVLGSEVSHLRLLGVLLRSWAAWRFQSKNTKWQMKNGK